MKTRLFILLTAWLPVGLIYFAASFVDGDIWIVPETNLESLIPFTPEAIWFYMLFFLYIPVTFYGVQKAKLKLLRTSFWIIAIFSGLIFFFLPSTMQYPNFETNNISSKFLSFVFVNDTSQNCFPSLHGALIMCCSIANWSNSKVVNLFYFLITLIFFYSIIAVRRHLFIDLSAGVLLSVLAWCLALFIHKSSASKNANDELFSKD